MSDVPQEVLQDLYRELYARFGLAYYHSESVHRQICLLLAISNITDKRLMTRPRMDELLGRVFSLTLGDAAREIEKQLPERYHKQLAEVVEARNFLAHRFWFERTPQIVRRDGVAVLLRELDGYSNLFQSMDRELNEVFRQRYIDIGVTDAIIRETLDKVVAGDLLEPLPSKDEIKGLEKKLKGKVRIIKVWELSTSDGKSTLIFEADSGDLWQLCDVGLGSTPFRQKESSWQEQKLVAKYLPAAIEARPKGAQMWRYEFELDKGAKLLVRPGREKGTFSWTIRTK